MYFKTDSIFCLHLTDNTRFFIYKTMTKYIVKFILFNCNMIIYFLAHKCKTRIVDICVL